MPVTILTAQLKPLQGKRILSDFFEKIQGAISSKWVTVHKPKGLFFASVSVIAVAKKETVRTPKDPDRYLGLGASELG